MAPPSTATAAASRRHAAATVGTSVPSRRSDRGAAPATRRASLRLVPPRSWRGNRRQRSAQGHERLLYGFSIALVLAALLAVVVGQALLANGQVRLSRYEHALSLEQSAHRQSELAVAQLETPSRVVGTATNELHMLRASVIDLPYVSLSVPVPTPKVTPASGSTTSTSAP